MSDMTVPQSELGAVSVIHAYECKFTVESREGLGGDFQRNTGGARKEKRISFEGYANDALYDALIDAMAKAAGE